MLLFLAVALGALIHAVGGRPRPVPPVVAGGCIAVDGLDFRVCPTSWLRSRAHNEAVGGARHSNHLLGCAVDWIPEPPGTVAALHAWATRALRGAWIEPLSESASHVHVDWRCHEGVS